MNAQNVLSLNFYSDVQQGVINFVAAALLIVFVDKPLWRAISITTIAMMVIILVIDSNAKARIDAYHKALELVEEAGLLK